jgi:ubiquinone/menaquinone biosynthesis C-methylase UbiE
VQGQGITTAEAQRYYDRLGRVVGWADPWEGRAKARALELLQLAPGLRVLNVGVGAGGDHQRLQRAVSPSGIVFGADISPVMLRLTRARTHAPLVRADCRLLPFAPASFDRIHCTYVLDLMPDADLPGILAEFRRVLKPGGCMALVSLTTGTTHPSRLFIATWNAIYSLAPSITGGCRPLSLASLVAAAGLQVVASEVIVQCAFPSEVVLAR